MIQTCSYLYSKLVSVFKQLSSTKVTQANHSEIFYSRKSIPCDITRPHSWNLQPVFTGENLQPVFTGENLQPVFTGEKLKG